MMNCCSTFCDPSVVLLANFDDFLGHAEFSFKTVLGYEKMFEESLSKDAWSELMVG